MSEYPLSQLLYILKIKQDNAQLELQKAKDNLKKAEHALEAAKKTLKDYKEWRPKEEERLFQKVMNKKVKNESVTDVKTEIGTLRDKEISLAEKVNDAKKHVEEMEQALEDARAAYQAASNRVSKISEHEDSWQLEHRKEQEALAEKELEEFSKRDPSDF